MRIRFWKMWALAAGFMTASAFVPALFGQESAAKSTPVTKPAKATAPAAAKPAATGKGRTVLLDLAVTSGVGAKGCRIEVKPANASCHFVAKTIEVAAGSTKAVKELVELKDVEIRGADRNLSIAITIREGDGTTKTIYRGYRVAADPKPGQVEQFTCWMSAPSRSAAVAAAPAPEPKPARR